MAFSDYMNFTYITAINEEWRVEKSKKSINVEGGKKFKINKHDSTFIREMRVHRLKVLFV